MNQNPIIKELQDELAKERSIAANKVYDEEGITTDWLCNGAFKLGHEAASARLLPLIQKAVEVFEDIAKMHPDANPIFRIEKAREFLTTLAGEIKKEIK